MKQLVVKKFVLAVAGVLVLAAPLLAAEEGYPLRKKFPDLKYVTTSDLNNQYDKSFIIDVRSKIEFDVIHINKAAHVPMAVATFANDLET